MPSNCAAWIQSVLLKYTGQSQQLPVTGICLETSSASPKVRVAKKQGLHFSSRGKFWSKPANGQRNQKPNTNVSVHIFFDCKTKWAFVCMPLLPKRYLFGHAQSLHSSCEAGLQDHVVCVAVLLSPRLVSVWIGIHVGLCWHAQSHLCHVSEENQRLPGSDKWFYRLTPALSEVLLLTGLIHTHWHLLYKLLLSTGQIVKSF